MKTSTTTLFCSRFCQWPILKHYKRQKLIVYPDYRLAASVFRCQIMFYQQCCEDKNPLYTQNDHGSIFHKLFMLCWGESGNHLELLCLVSVKGQLLTRSIIYLQMALFLLLFLWCFFVIVNAIAQYSNCQLLWICYQMYYKWKDLVSPLESFFQSYHVTNNYKLMSLSY